MLNPTIFLQADHILRVHQLFTTSLTIIAGAIAFTLVFVPLLYALR